MIIYYICIDFKLFNQIYGDNYALLSVKAQQDTKLFLAFDIVKYTLYKVYSVTNL